jgi:flagellar basal body-associated protein FliL
MQNHDVGAPRHKKWKIMLAIAAVLVIVAAVVGSAVGGTVATRKSVHAASVTVTTTMYV